MEILNKNFEQFNLKCLNEKRKTRFALPFGEEDVRGAIIAAYTGEVNKRGNKYIAHKDIEKKAESVSKWLTDPEGRSGLLLYGSIGTGKTTMTLAVCDVINYFTKPEYEALVLRDNDKKSINIIRAKEVVEAYQNDRVLFDRMCKVELLAIDEFGVEAIDVKSFGNSNEPIIDLLSLRYDRQKPTVISSNLDLEQIKERYGLRLQDRFVEMFKMVSFNGKSYRQ